MTFRTAVFFAPDFVTPWWRKAWFRNGLAVIMLPALAVGFGALVVRGIVKEQEFRDRIWAARCSAPNVPASMKPYCQSWRCTSAQCCFDGLDYCVPNDQGLKR